MSGLIEALNWRYAVRQFNGEASVDNDVLGQIVEAARLAPSGYGLQPYRLYAVKDPQVVSQLLDASLGLNKQKNASQLLVIAALNEVSDSYIDQVVSMIASQRNLDSTVASTMSAFFKGTLSSMSVEQQHQWAIRQAYLCLGVILSQCALLRADACPMEGIDCRAFNEILGIDTATMQTVVAVAIGERSAHDPAGSARKVRIDTDEFCTRLE